MSLRLVAAVGGRSLELELPRGRAYMLGRSAQCDLAVREPTVSRRHAELEPDGAVLRFRDLGSTNGTFLNGKRVTEGVARGGDTLGFGKMDFAVQELLNEPPHVARDDDLLDATIIRQVPVRGPGEPLAGGTVTASAIRRAGSGAERQALQLALLLDIAKTLSRHAELDRLLEKVAEVAFEVMSADRVGILTGEPLAPRVWRTRGDGTPAPWSVPQGVVRKAMEERLALLIENAPADVRFGGGTLHAHGVQSAMCAPLLGSRGCLGIVYLDNLSLIHSFDADDLDFLSAFAGIVAVAIENSELVEQVRREAVVLSNFQRYFAPDLAAQIAGRAEQVQLGGVKTRVVVLFADVRGFTALTEGLTPEEIAGLLNDYFTEMVEIVFQHGGTLDKFMGDALMALWGAPLARPDDADRAVAAAAAMQREVERLNAAWAERGRPRLEVGIGLSAGDVFAGNIGSERRLEYTVLGDAVNTASHLCAQAGGGEVLISEPLRAALAAPPAVEPLPPMQLKGKSQAVPVYRVAW
ncbi:MAG TPA: adenylate/guanylate cyclase domain-containing protein [Thermoanaerobaculia bacterium]|nr:adenylate/guanylate cyclase domain-containing protein [Thermoanaerobaculia bacterium]